MLENSKVTHAGMARHGRRKKGWSFGLLCLEKIEMMRGAGSVTDCQAMTNGLGKIGLGRLYGIVYGFASCEMGCDGRGERTASAMRVGGIDEFSLEHIEEPTVIE